jgi:hypothetical protein
MYGGGQAKDTEVLVPEESTGPSPFGHQKKLGQMNQPDDDD